MEKQRRISKEEYEIIKELEAQRMHHKEMPEAEKSGKMTFEEWENLEGNPERQYTERQYKAIRSVIGAGHAVKEGYDKYGKPLAGFLNKIGKRAVYNEARRRKIKPSANVGDTSNDVLSEATGRFGF